MIKTILTVIMVSGFAFAVSAQVTAAASSSPKAALPTASVQSGIKSTTGVTAPPAPVNQVTDPALIEEKKPEFSFTEESHDFGKIPQGTPVTTTITYTNIGEDPLTLLKVQPTCSCIVANYTQNPVKKGDKGIITITFDAAAAGQFRKKIVIMSNAKRPTKILDISGDVLAKTGTSAKL